MAKHRCRNAEAGLQHTVRRDLGRKPVDRAAAVAEWYHNPYHWLVTTHTASSARAKLFQLIDEVAEAHQPIEIIGKRNNAVLVSQEDWQAIQETLYLLAIPKMRESLRKAAKEPLTKMARKVTW